MSNSCHRDNLFNVKNGWLEGGGGRAPRERKTSPNLLVGGELKKMTLPNLVVNQPQHPTTKHYTHFLKFPSLICPNASSTCSTGLLQILFVQTYRSVLFSLSLFSSKGRSSLSIPPITIQSGRYFFCKARFLAIASLPITATS